MIKAGLIVAAMLVATPALATPVAPVMHRTDRNIVRTGGFANCYMDYFMRGQNTVMQKFGPAAGAVVWTLASAVGGAFNGYLAAQGCALETIAR